MFGDEKDRQYRQMANDEEQELLMMNSQSAIIHDDQLGTNCSASALEFMQMLKSDDTNYYLP
jgi:hypothetical protein